jgi:hypothetical protein
MDARINSALAFFVASALSTTTGASLTRVDPPAGAGALAPHLTASTEGVILSWLEPAGGDHAYRFRMSRLVKGTWAPPADIIERADLFVNWADIPSVIACDDGTLLCHWLQKSGPETYAYDVVLARSTDEGKTWKTLGSPHQDGTQTEHGFVSLLKVDGDIRAFWLDGRWTSGHGEGAMALRSSLIGRDVPLEDGAAIDGRVCECCNTSAALTENGPIVVYRDRSPNETRDVGIVRWVDGAWTRPQVVSSDGWKLSGCPVNGPAVDAAGSNVVVVWYTGAGDQVRAAFSTDGGATFGKPIVIDDDRPIGRVAVHLDPGGDAIVCWIGQEEGEGVVRLRRVSSAGALGDVFEIARVSADRASGFPSMVRVGDDLVVAWTDGRRASPLGTAVIPVADVP